MTPSRPVTLRRVAALALLVACAGAWRDAAVAGNDDGQVVSLVVKGGRLAAGPQVIKLKRDDKVTLNVLSDRADELHVHGYDLQLKLAPDQTATLQFAAKRTGRFTLELHKSGTELAVFEIYPK